MYEYLEKYYGSPQQVIQKIITENLEECKTIFFSQNRP